MKSSSKFDLILRTEHDSSWLAAMRTPPPRAFGRSARNRLKLGKSVSTSESEMWSLSQVSVRINMLLLDVSTRLDTCSRFEMKLRILVKITEMGRRDLPVGFGRRINFVSICGCYASLTV